MDEATMAPQVQAPYASSSKLKAARMSMKRSGGSLERNARLAVRENGGWMGSGIVNSASRILTKSAAFLFNSMFKRQGLITAPSPVAEDGDDVPPLEIAQSVEAGERGEDFVDPGADLNNALSAPLQAADLENILMEKDLSREECERYISLIQSKIIDTGLQPGSSSPPPTEAFKSTRTVFSPEDQRLENDKVLDTSQALVPWEELSFGAAPPTTVDRRVRFQQPRARSERWTPIQMPISGGRELLKKRATVLDDKVASSKDASPPRASFSLRGPSLVPSPTLKRKPSSEAMDLTCFRSAAAATKTRKTSLRLDVPCSIPGQSSRTAQKILNTLERRSAFKNPDPDDDSTRPTAKAPRPSRARVPALSASLAPPSGFSFPSTAHGPEPPTPKPIPSPYSEEKKTSRDATVASANHVKNGLLPCFQETSFDKFSTPFGNGLDSSLYSGEEAYDRIAERVEKASSVLAGPGLTVSPSFSDGVIDFQTSAAAAAAAVGGFETASSSGRRREESAANPFQMSTAGSLTTTLAGGMTGPGSSTARNTTSFSAVETEGNKEGGLFEAWKSPSSSSDRFWVGAAQSLAPPDANPSALTRPGLSLAAKRQKSTKRFK